MKIEIDDRYVVEVFEILCNIPFETPSMSDIEPSNKRHPGIEQILKQLQITIDA